MGKGTFRANVLGNRTNHVASFLTIGDARTTMVASELTSKTTTATNYITVGTNRYIFFTNSDTQATVVGEATALAGATVKGSIALGDNLWHFTSDTAATRLT